MDGHQKQKVAWYVSAMRVLSAATILMVLSASTACGDDTAATSDSGSTSGGTTGAPTTGSIPVDPSTGAMTGSGESTAAGSGSSEATAGVTTDSTGSSGSGDTSGSSSSSGDASTGETTGLTACDAVGERVYMGDGCNFCDCTEAGLDSCTERACTPISDGCTYDGTTYAYAEQFDAADECNACVCAASGLACTRRPECDPDFDEGAILLESADDPCGPFDDFTGAWVIENLAPLERTGPLDYDNAGPLYPEALMDTTMTVRVTFPEDGYTVCRIPSPGQEALDLEAVLEWQSEDGAFDEGQHTYVRRNYGGFLEAFTGVGALEPAELSGTYTPGCPDAGGISIAPRWNDTGDAEAGLFKTCEVDIGLTVGQWAAPGMD